MQFGLSEEQTMLQASLSRFLGARGGLERTRAFAAGKELRAQDVIAGLAEVGVTGLLVPEAYGGSGLNVLDAALAAEMLGYHVTPAPFIGAFALAPLAIARAGSLEQKSALLPGIASGERIIGVALSEHTGARENAGVIGSGGRLSGRVLFPLDFAADAYLVADRVGQIYLVEATAPGVTRQQLTTIDATRPAGEVLFDAASAAVLPGGNLDVVNGLIDAGRVLLAADTLGAAQCMLDQAVVYAKGREQFGRPIATFQAVKHMCAEMAAALEPCRALVWYAGHAQAALPDEATVVACHAKAHLAEVGAFVAKTATEVHGGMGFTDLVGLHYWFKRIGFNRQALGGPQFVREAAARAQGLVSSAASA